MNEDFTILPNPDFVFRKQVEEEIKNNNGYCTSVLKQNDDTKCICKDFKEQKLIGLRFSLQPYIRQSWMENVPLYAIESVLENGNANL